MTRPAPSPEFEEITELPSTLRARGVRAYFSFASAGPAHAALAALVPAVVCGVVERWLWLPAPLDLPIATLLTGFLVTLVALLPLRLAAAIACGAWAGEVVGLLLPAVGPVLPGGPDRAIRVATLGTVVGMLAGLGVHIAFQRLRPPLDRRFFVGFPVGFVAALVGGVLGLVLMPPPPGAPLASAWFTHIGALGLAMLLVAPAGTVLWLYGHGMVLVRRTHPAEFAGYVLLAGVAILGIRHEWLGLGGIFWAVCVASLLVVVGTRVAMRTAAPTIAVATVAAIACLVTVRTDGGAAWLADPPALAGLQLSLVFVLACIFLQMAGFTARLLLEQRLRAYAKQLTAADDDARRTSAAGVREGLAQSLAGIRFALGALNNDSLPLDVRRSIDATIAALRSAQEDAEIVHRELGPIGLEEVGLEGVLESYLRRLEDRAEGRIALEVRGGSASLPLRLRQLAFRVIAEVVGSAVRDARPEGLRVAVEANAAALVIVVSEAGTTFAAEHAIRGEHGASTLVLLRERVAIEGGVLQLRATDGGGTEVRVTLPVSAVEAWSRA